mmetsp:Transcript_28151/g.58442  ORF Transcript_28151/g.58442 Transcript_28151/m.58442 type:complete len:251 (+) Transcript_28151:866-1618(+)
MSMVRIAVSKPSDRSCLDDALRCVTGLLWCSSSVAVRLGCRESSGTEYTSILPSSRPTKNCRVVSSQQRERALMPKVLECTRFQEPSPAFAQTCSAPSSSGSTTDQTRPRRERWVESSCVTSRRLACGTAERPLTPKRGSSNVRRASGCSDLIAASVWESNAKNWRSCWLVLVSGRKRRSWRIMRSCSRRESMADWSVGEPSKVFEGSFGRPEYLPAARFCSSRSKSLKRLVTSQLAAPHCSWMWYWYVE